MMVVIGLQGRDEMDKEEDVGECGGGAYMSHLDYYG